jgi:uncharacterized protein with FMN-binding domain
MKGKSGLHCMIPSLLIIAAVIFTLNTGFPSPEALAAGNTASAAVKQPSSKTATKTLKKDTGSKKSTSPYKAKGDLSKCADGTYYGSARGYAGNIRVRVVIKDHKMISIDVVEVEADDAPYVAKAKKGVISAMLKTQSLSVDSVSGATYSSNGIIKAVENAIARASGKSVNDKKSGTKKKKPSRKHDTSLDGSKFRDGVYTGTGTGFNGRITVSVTISGGKITKISVINNEGDDKPYLDKASKGVVARILSTQNTKVDAVSGATYSSNGIIEAVEKALKKAAIKPGTDDPKDPEMPTEPDKPSEPDTPSGPDEPEDGLYIDGTYEGFARGFKGFMYVSVLIENSRITSIDITKTQDDEPFLTKAKTLIKTIISRQTTEGVDAVSGATYSSNGILDSVKKALDKARKSEQDAGSSGSTGGSTDAE